VNGAGVIIGQFPVAVVWRQMAGNFPHLIIDVAAAVVAASGVFPLGDPESESHDLDAVQVLDEDA